MDRLNFFSVTNTFTDLSKLARLASTKLAVEPTIPSVEYDAPNYEVSLATTFFFKIFFYLTIILLYNRVQVTKQFEQSEKNI